ncbi:MAG: DUF559 domain-containing protein [Chloroflexi bacterium]|nr:DUF559 domain-containing protein [Chloroflexota bacterium]
MLGLVADFCRHQARLVVEVDGGVHAGHVEYDAERDRQLERLGRRVLHVSNQEVEADLPGVLARIRKWLE